jgi:hypothetical protein
MLTYNYMKIRLAIIGKNVGTGTGNFPIRIRIPWKARFGFRHSLVWKVEFESAYDECDEISLVIDTVHTIQFAYKRFYFFLLSHQLCRTSSRIWSHIWIGFNPRQGEVLMEKILKGRKSRVRILYLTYSCSTVTRIQLCPRQAALPAPWQLWLL